MENISDFIKKGQSLGESRYLKRNWSFLYLEKMHSALADIVITIEFSLVQEAMYGQKQS